MVPLSGIEPYGAALTRDRPSVARPILSLMTERRHLDQADHHRRPLRKGGGFQQRLLLQWFERAAHRERGDEPLVRRLTARLQVGLDAVPPELPGTRGGQPFRFATGGGTTRR